MYEGCLKDVLEGTAAVLIVIAAIMIAVIKIAAYVKWIFM